MNLQGIMLSEKKVNLNNYILYDSVLCNILEVTKCMEIEKRLAVIRVKEEVGLGGKWVRLQKGHMREPVVMEWLCFDYFNTNILAVYCTTVLQAVTID